MKYHQLTLNFDTVNKLYKDLSKVEIKKQSKKNNNNCVKNTSLLYNKWIDMYKKEYEQVFENKDEKWRKKHDYKNLKDFSCQVDEVNKADVTEKEDEDETDQELPPCIKVTKSRFNEIREVITRANESKLMTRLEKRNVTLKNAEKLLEDVISEKGEKYVYNNIAEDVNRLNKLKPTESRKKNSAYF